MLTDSEQRQILIEQVSDHLIDRDDYFALDADSLSAFMDWALDNYGDYTDIDGLDIDQMFDKWLAKTRKAA